MGSGSSSPSEPEVREVVKEVYVESDESKRMKIIGKLENQLAELKKEVADVPPSIKQKVKETVSSEQDALLMRYSQLSDKRVIEKNIREIFGKFPLLEFLVDTATTLVAAINNTKELTEVLRWHERKLVKRVGNKVYGIEAHYKVKIMEEEKGSFLSGSKKETVVLIAYKCLAHVMDLVPEEYPDDSDLKQIRF